MPTTHAIEAAKHPARMGLYQGRLLAHPTETEQLRARDLIVQGIKVAMKIPGAKEWVLDTFYRKGEVLPHHEFSLPAAAAIYTLSFTGGLDHPESLGLEKIPFPNPELSEHGSISYKPPKELTDVEKGVDKIYGPQDPVTTVIYISNDPRWIASEGRYPVVNTLKAWRHVDRLIKELEALTASS